MTLLYHWIPTIAAGLILALAALVLRISLRHKGSGHEAKRDPL